MLLSQPRILANNLSNQTAPTLSDLAEAIRAAHSAVVAACSFAIDSAIEAGNALRIARASAGHGQWTGFVRSCDLNDRTARRYMQLADLAAKRSCTTDLEGLTIEGAIKRLSPPPNTTAPKPPPAKAVAMVETVLPGRRSTHIAIIEAWLAASPTDRTAAIDGIGLDAVLTATPPAWLPLLAEHLADRLAQLTTRPAGNGETPVAGSDYSIPADLSIPQWMQRGGEQSVCAEGDHA